jgi:hypothetical protein
VLPIPNPTLAIPGVIFIGGEKITYYTNDTVNNRLGQIRRAVDGTAAFNPNVIVWTPNTSIGTGNVVYFNGNIGTVTGNVFGNAFANAIPTISANISPIRVVDASIEQIIPYSTPTYTEIDGNLTMQDTSWYTPGVGTATDGTGLINSTTTQAEFLLASPGYTP